MSQSPAQTAVQKARWNDRNSDRGQVSIVMILSALVVVTFATTLLVFAEAGDTKFSARKASDAASLAAAKEARGAWLHMWLLAMGQAAVPAPPPESVLPELQASDMDTMTPKEINDYNHKREKQLEALKNFKGAIINNAPSLDPLWTAAAEAGRGSAYAYAHKNDQNIVSQYFPGNDHSISVTVDRSRQTETSPGKRFIKNLHAKESATAAVITPAGFVCTPLPGSWKKWTLLCTSAKGSAKAHYSGNILLDWDKKAFERMFKVKLVK